MLRSVVECLSVMGCCMEECLLCVFVDYCGVLWRVVEYFIVVEVGNMIECCEVLWF